MPTTRLSNEDIEKRNNILKNIGVFLLFFTLALAFALAFADTQKQPAQWGVIAGIIVAGIVSIIFIFPAIQLSTYPISLTVLYPNHPNLTITQNCTPFTTGYNSTYNGQELGRYNTTDCLINGTAYSCSITNKTISCTTSNSTWQGTILNVSKR